jgi:hypothetical protein
MTIRISRVPAKHESVKQKEAWERRSEYQRVERLRQTLAIKLAAIAAARTAA